MAAIAASPRPSAVSRMPPLHASEPGQRAILA
jgi:hypothetical protein